MATEKRLIDANELLELYDLGEELEDCASVLSVPIPVIRQNIKDMPTVDAVEVVHGRWVMKETMIRSPFAKNAYCSVCLEETANAHNYCPNCGAKMDGLINSKPNNNQQEFDEDLSDGALD